MMTTMAVRRRRFRGSGRQKKRAKLDYSRFDFSSSTENQNAGEPNEHINKSTPKIRSLSQLLFRRQTLGSKATISVDSHRSTHHRVLKFRELGTSPSEAILGLNATADYLVSLSSPNMTDDLFCLSLFPLPSPSSKRLFSPIIRIPLEDTYNPTTTSGQHSTSVSIDMLPPSPVRVPVRIWLSADSRIGACLHRTGGDGLATALVFSLRRQQVYWRMRNISIPSEIQWDSSPCDCANLLWYVDVVPLRGRPVVTYVSAYLYLVDEGDGFRTTWFCSQGWKWNELQEHNVGPCWEAAGSSDGCKVVRGTEESRILVSSSWEDAGWEQCGQTNSSKRDNKSELDIPLAGFFSTSVLLHCILTLRPKLVKPEFDPSSAYLPNYAHHVVSVKSGGRIIEVLLVFSVGPVGKGCVGVFVDVDLVTQDFCVHPRWSRLTGVDTPPADCGKLANRRRKEMMLRNNNNNNDGDTAGVLYADCVTIDNRAVRQQRPVYELAARDAPVRIVYR